MINFLGIEQGKCPIATRHIRHNVFHKVEDGYVIFVPRWGSPARGAEENEIWAFAFDKIEVVRNNAEHVIDAGTKYQAVAKLNFDYLLRHWLYGCRFLESTIGCCRIFIVSLLCLSFPEPKYAMSCSNTGDLPNLQSIVTISEDVVMREVGDELVMLNIADENYFGMNSIGAQIMKLAQSPVALKAIVDSLFAEYEVERDLLERDIRLIACELIEAGLLKSVPSQ